MEEAKTIYKNFLQPRDAWDALSMKEKAEMIGVAVRNGITNLNDIREKYNEFAEGGSVDTDWSYNSWKRQIAEHMGIRPDEDNTYDYEAYFKKYPEEAWKMLKGDPTAHFSDEFKTVYHPTFSSKSIGNDGSIYSGVRNPKTNPQGLVGGTWSPDYHTFTMSPDGYRGPVSMDDRKWYLENAEDNGVQLREANGSLPIYDGIPWGGVLPNVTIYGSKRSLGGPLVGDAVNEYKKGGGIYIKKSHRGRLTELKERTGKTEAELYRTGGPSVRKMITFARNARKWKHGLGGNLFSGEENHSNRMATTGGTGYAPPALSSDFLYNTILNLSSNIMTGIHNWGDEGYTYGDVGHTPTSGNRPEEQNGGIAQRTFLAGRKIQEEEFKKHGFIKDTSGNYGLVKKEVGNNKYPIWQRTPDEISRDKLIAIGNTYDGFTGIPRDKAIIHGGSYPTAYYVDPSTVGFDFESGKEKTPKFYAKSWDLNDYGGEGGSTAGIFGKALDFIGFPVVQTTGYIDITDSRLKKVDNMLEDYLYEKGLVKHRLDVNNPYGAYFYGLPEVTVTGKKRKKALGGNLFDGTTQPTQKMQIGLNVQGWPDYTTEQIVSYGDENERRRKALEGEKSSFLESLWNTIRDTNLAYIDHPSVMTAVGQTAKISNIHYPTKEEKQLADNLAIIGEMGLTAPTLIGDIEAAYQAVRHPIQTAKTVKKSTKAIYQGTKKAISKIASKLNGESKLPMEGLYRVGNQYSMLDSFPLGTLEETKQAAELGRQDVLNWQNSQYNKDRWLRYVSEEDADRILARQNQLANEPFDYSMTAEELTNDINAPKIEGGITFGLTKDRPMETAVIDGHTYSNFNTGTDVRIGSNIGAEARKTAISELMHHTSGNSIGYPDSGNFEVIIGDWLSPVGLKFPKENATIMPKGDAWQNFLVKQNNSLMPPESTFSLAVKNAPDDVVDALIKYGESPRDAQNIVDRASYMADIQEQMEHLKTAFLSDIRPHIKNPNDAAEIERYITMHPEIIYDDPHLSILVNRLRPGTFKHYAKYFAEALSSLPVINAITNERK